MGEEDYVSFSERLEIREKEGLRKGRLEGHREGKLEGETKKLISLICKKLKKGNTEEEIAEMLEEELDVIQAICEIARPYAPDYDVEAICKAYMEKEEKA